MRHMRSGLHARRLAAFNAARDKKEPECPRCPSPSPEPVVRDIKEEVKEGERSEALFSVALLRSCRGVTKWRWALPGSMALGSMALGTPLSSI